MSFVKNYTSMGELEEDISYHSSESNYHFKQYLEALSEAHKHWQKHEEHSTYEAELIGQLNGVLYA